MKNQVQQTVVWGLVFFLLITSVFMQTTKVNAAEPPIEIEAETAILVDFKSGKILYEKKADKKMSPASMTKMMTEYLILEAINKGTISWDTKVNISDYVYKVSQNYALSNVPLRRNITYTAEELYKAMAIYSANGATIALAELIAGTETEFVRMMNEKAKELDLKTYKFVNSTGLNNKSLFGQHPAGGPNEENIMSARATAKLAYHLLKDQPDVLEIASIPFAQFTKGIQNPIAMPNWNLMLDGSFKYEGVDGLKTGSTEKAGFCFTGTAERGDTRLISVVMNTDSKYERFRQTRTLLDFGFHRFKTATFVEEGFVPEDKKQLPVTKGTKDNVGIEVSDTLTTVIKNGTEEKYKTELVINESSLTEAGELTAPVEKGQTVGTMKLTFTGESKHSYLINEATEATEVDVVTTDKVEKANWFSLVLRAIGDFFAGIWESIVEAVKGWF